MAWGLRQDAVEKSLISQSVEEAMSIPKRIRMYLDSQEVPYEWLKHSEAFTAQEVAHALHLSGKRLAKTVVVEADSRMVMAVLPASHRLVMSELRGVVEAREVKLLPEEELEKIFPGCDLGAIPPLGDLYGMDVWVDRTIADQEEIVFNAGTHADAVRMKYHDFSALVKPRIGRFSELRATSAAA
jgi:Ala-tRNA(Pro) deacylase